MTTPFKHYLETWKDGCGSAICPSAFNKGEGASRIVHARGDIPADIAFIGEAPGESEDSIGFPFVGPAGKLIDKMVANATRDPNARRALKGVAPLRTAFFNLVGCIPKYDGAQKADEPAADDIQQCLGRCQHLLSIVRPKIVVAVGKHAKEWSEPGILGGLDVGEAHWIHVVHPAAIIRANIAQQGLMKQGAEVSIRAAIFDAGLA